MGLASSLEVAKVGVDVLWEIMEYRRDTGTGRSACMGRAEEEQQ